MMEHFNELNTQGIDRDQALEMLHHKGLVHIAEVFWNTLREIGGMLE